MGGNGKGQSYIHSAGVVLHWCIYEFPDLGKIHNRVEFAANLVSCQPNDRSVEIDIFSPGEFLVKTGTHFQEGAHTAEKLCPSKGRLRDPGEDLQQCAFPG